MLRLETGTATHTFSPESRKEYAQFIQMFSICNIGVIFFGLGHRAGVLPFWTPFSFRR